MSLEKIRLLSSAVSHMPLIFTFRDSGVTEKYGFKLEVDIAGFDRPGKPPRPMSERASLLLQGEYEFDEGDTGDQHLEKAWSRRAQRLFYQRCIAGQGDVVGRYHSHQWGYPRHAQHGRLGCLRLESYRRDDEPVGYLLCRAQAYRQAR